MLQMPQTAILAMTGQNARLPAAWRSIRRRVADRQMPTACQTASPTRPDHSATKNVHSASGT